MTSLKNLLLTGIGVANLALTGCDHTCIKKVEDLTGDGNLDILLYDHDWMGFRNGDYLFIGQKNGEFVKAREILSGGYFETDNGKKYFFDGKFYRLSPKQKK